MSNLRLAKVLRLSTDLCNEKTRTIGDDAQTTLLKSLSDFQDKQFRLRHQIYLSREEIEKKMLNRSIDNGTKKFVSKFKALFTPVSSGDHACG